MDRQALITRFEAELGKVNRPGIDKLMGYIRGSDFYTAPASTKFHLSCEGGLLHCSTALTFWTPCGACFTGTATAPGSTLSPGERRRKFPQRA